jgi:hypothetical protein
MKRHRSKSDWHLKRRYDDGGGDNGSGDDCGGEGVDCGDRSDDGMMMVVMRMLMW